jgi:integrase
MARRTRGKSEGTIYCRSDGRWEARVDLGYVNGKRKRKCIYAHSRLAVAALLTEAQHKVQRNLPVSFEPQSVATYLNKWLDSIRPPMTRPRTFERFDGIVRCHLVPAFGSVRLDKLTPQRVQELLTAKLDDGLSPQSVRHLRTVLGIALNRAVKFDLVGRNVVRLTDPPPIERQPVSPLKPEEAKKLLKAAEGDRLEAVYTVALALGLRRGEALGLAWEDVDLDAGTLRVNRSLQRVEHKLQLLPPKTAGSRRSIMLPEITVRALRKHRARQAEERLAAGTGWIDTGLVFTTGKGTPLEPRNVVRHFKALLKRAELPASRFHDLRHTAASLLLAQGTHPRVVMEILGHSRITLTMDTYSHVMPSVMNDAAAKMDSILTARA